MRVFRLEICDNKTTKNVLASLETLKNSCLGDGNEFV